MASTSITMAGHWARPVPERVWERRFAILKEMGVNAIRTAHNPFAPEFLDLADRMGFLVMNEAFDEWTSGKVPEGYHKYFDEWSERDLAEFVRRDRNHPSVVLWSAGNEIGEQGQPNGHEVLRRLQDIIHREDPTRPVTTGNDHIYADDNPATPAFLNTLDVVGYNYVDRWHERRELYATARSARSSRVEDDRHGERLAERRRARRVFAGTRFGRRATELHVPDDPSRAALEVRVVARLLRRRFHVDGHRLPRRDDLAEQGGASSGPIDMAGFPKDAFYFYQSQWTSKPVLHLFPHWNWTGREGQLIPVIAYTNCQAVELFLNGRSMGEKRLEFPGRARRAGGTRTLVRR